VGSAHPTTLKYRFSDRVWFLSVEVGAVSHGQTYSLRLVSMPVPLKESFVSMVFAVKLLISVHSFTVKGSQYEGDGMMQIT